MKFIINPQTQLETLICFTLSDEITLPTLLSSDELTALTKVIERQQYKAKANTVLPFVSADKNILVVGLGDKANFTADVAIQAIEPLYAQLKALNIHNIAIDLTSFPCSQSAIRFISEALINQDYHYDELKSEKEAFKLNSVEFICAKNADNDHAIKVGQAIANGQSYAKTLKNMPANKCTTQYMFDQAKALASSDGKFTFSYLDEAQMQKLGMECILAVGQGSKSPTYIACMEYHGGAKGQKPIVLVGKGLAFDTGGLCIKPAEGMGTMKMDMGGAASVFGTMQAIRDLQLPINVVGVVVLVENSVDALSFRPGDVLKSMAGITVEIGNTDAEGRLALCDALTYIEKYNPETVIDIATLTGAIIIGLGSDLTGLFANDDHLAAELENAGKQSHDLAWRLPLHPAYEKLLKSDVADMNNVGGREAGSITAALYLARFTKSYKWAHLDVAGSAMGNFSVCKASGRPVPLLTQYLMNCAKA